MMSVPSSSATPMEITDTPPLPSLPTANNGTSDTTDTAPMEIDSHVSAPSISPDPAGSARTNRVSSRANAREVISATVSAISNAAGVEITERDLLKAQSARERQLEQQEMMDEPTQTPNTTPTPTPAKKTKAPVTTNRFVAMRDDIDEEEAALYLDKDTQSRTKHNKKMRGLIKDGLVKQERFIRKHIKEFRAFLSKKMRRKYESGTAAGEEPEQDTATDSRQQAANARAGVQAAQQAAANPEGARVDLPSSSSTDALADAADLALPQSKVFTKQPPYIINGEMREYQVHGLNWLISRHENCVGGILGDEMGLGKTLQIISFLSYLKYERGINGPHLIVVPLSVMSAWMTEFKRWSPGIKVVRYHGPLAERRRLQNDDAAYGNFDALLTTYEMVVGDEDYFRYKMIWQYIIVDEAHRIKNEKTMQAQSLASIQRFNCILLSGTPTQNNTHEIWALLHFLLPKVFTSSEPFDSCFNLTTNSIDQEQLLKIHTLLRPLMLRRVKSEMLQKLPPKTETKIFVGLTELQREWYRKLVSKDINLLLTQSANTSDAASSAATAVASAAGANPSETGQVPTTYTQGSSDWRRLLNLMMNLRKICNHAYLISGEAEPRWDLIRKQEAQEDAERRRAGQKPLQRESIEVRAGKALIASSGKMIVLDKLLSKLKAEGGHRVLLFSLFTRVLDLLEDFFAFKGWNYLRLDGSTNRVRRSVDIRRFNDPNGRFFVYLISTRAGGLGINLTAADTVVHFDSDFNPQVDLQAQDRCHRIGQTKPVNVYRFITENTVEERLIARAEKKLYLDMMVNRTNHLAEDANLGSEQEELTKLSKGEMLEMLMFGASRIFKATGGEPLDEDIEAILKRSRAKDGDAKASKLKTYLERRAALNTGSAASPTANEMSLMDEDTIALIEREKAELQALGQGDVDMTEEKSNALAASSSAAAPAASPTSSNVTEGAQLTVRDILFDGKGETPVHVFEGKDFSQLRKTKKDITAEHDANLIVEDGRKRDRRQRLLTVEDSRGRSFTILASQADDLPLRSQLATSTKRKRGRPAKDEWETLPADAFIAPPTPKKRNNQDEEEANAPKIIGHDYAINWQKSTAHTAKGLEKAVEALNALDLSGVDVSEKEHKLSLWIKRSDRWNMSQEDRLAYERKVHDDLKQMIALRDAKRRRWQEGAKEEEWYADNKIEIEKEKAELARQGKQKARAENGDYKYNNKYVHEDWCHLCKLGGDLLCCGYCPRCFHLECVGLNRAPSGYFSCPQHKCAKCLLFSSLVTMADGTTRAVETLQVGDLLLGEDGRTVLVTENALTDELGLPLTTNEAYSIIVEGCDAFSVTSDHLMTISWKGGPKLFDMPVNKLVKRQGELWGMGDSDQDSVMARLESVPSRKHERSVAPICSITKLAPQAGGYRYARLNVLAVDQDRMGTEADHRYVLANSVLTHNCERSSQEAGGMLFRCVVCPCAYCEDDVPTEYEGRKDLDRCFELEMTGYSQPSSAFFITCSQSCTKYYQDYLDGKYADSAATGEVSVPIPIDLVNEKNAANWAEQEQQQKQADAALQAATADAAAKGKRGGRKGASASPPPAAASTPAAAAASSASPSVPYQNSDGTFLFEPPKEIGPHVCSCLVPKKQKPKLYCVCRTPYDKRRNYLACDGCSCWYHLTCVGMKEDADVDSIEWTCKACLLKDKQKASKSSGVFELDSDAESSSSDSGSDDADDDSDSSASEPSVGSGGEPPSKKKKIGRPSKAPTPRGAGSTGLASLPMSGAKATQKKPKKIKHPIDGGSPMDTQMASMMNGAAGASQYPLPTIEQCFAMNMQLTAANQPQASNIPLGGMDPQAWANMMAMFGTSGGIVGSDGRVSQLNNLPSQTYQTPMMDPNLLHTQQLLNAAGSNMQNHLSMNMPMSAATVSPLQMNTNTNGTFSMPLSGTATMHPQQHQSNQMTPQLQQHHQQTSTMPPNGNANNISLNAVMEAAKAAQQ